ncbi:MAG: YdcF family protein [Chloroflexi bacterium]|nr:YdcF family protein [Chloroflexota bacterium]
MFFFLSKFLPLFIYPLGLGTILIVMGLIIRKKQGVQTAVLLTAFLALYLGGNPFISRQLARSLERQYLPAAPLPTADVIVVLGGGTDAAYSPQPIVGLNAAGDRILYAAWLYQQGISDTLMLSGGVLPGKDSVTSVEMAEALHIMGIPDDALWHESHSINTYENGFYVKELLAERQISRIILVTSAIHMPRSVAVFENQGLEVIPAPTDFRVVDAEWNATQSENLLGKLFEFVPNVHALMLTTDAMKEYIGILIYGWRGWL